MKRLPFLLLSGTAVLVVVAIVWVTWLYMAKPIVNRFVDSRNIDAELFVPEGASNPETGTTSTEEALLKEPALDYLARVSGDPVPKEGEIAVRVPILMFHHIRPMQTNFRPVDRRFTVTPSSFETEMQALVDAGYHTITPDELAFALTHASSSLPEKPVLLTFDDGFRDQYENAFPVLKKLHLKATFFVITQLMNLHVYDDAKMVQELDRSGLITIASHTRHHAFLTRHSSAVRLAEIIGSKQDLEDLLGHPVNTFAYPYGGWNPTILKEVEQAGYTLAFGVRLGSLHTPSSRYQLRRIQVNNGEEIVPLLDRFRK